MKVVVRGETREERMIVVELSVDRDKWNYLKMFHCPIDQTPLFKYSGDIMSISNSGMWGEMAIVCQCKTCKSNYLVIRPSLAML